jgi:uncharacterized membrane protein YgcG
LPSNVPSWLVKQAQPPVQQPVKANYTGQRRVDRPAPAPQPYQGGTYAPKNYYNTATPFTTGQAPYSGQGTYMPQNPGAFTTAEPAKFPYRDNISGYKPNQINNPFDPAPAPRVGYQDYYRMMYGANDYYSGGPYTPPTNNLYSGGPYKPKQPPRNPFVLTWDEVYKHYGAPPVLEPFEAPPTVDTTNSAGNGGGGGGYGGYPDWYGSGGGGGGYGGGGWDSSPYNPGFYLNPTVWRI